MQIITSAALSISDIKQLSNDIKSILCIKNCSLDPEEDYVVVIIKTKLHTYHLFHGFPGDKCGGPVGIITIINNNIYSIIAYFGDDGLNITNKDYEDYINIIHKQYLSDTKEMSQFGYPYVVPFL